MTDEERGYVYLGSMEMQRLRPSHSPEPTLTDGVHEHPESAAPRTNGHATSTTYEKATDRMQLFWDRLRGKGRTPVSWTRSIRNIVCSSCE